MATLSGNKIKNTYQSLVKFSDNGNITVGAKQLTDGFGNNSPMWVSTTQVGIGVTPESGLNLHVYGDAKIGSNLTVIGNLVVEGSTTTVGTDTLTVKDPLIVLANNNTSTDAVDIGFYGKYTPSGTTLYSGLFREALTGKYRLFKDLQVEPTTTVNTSGTGYAVATLIANLEGNFIGGTISSTGANFSGNIIIESGLGVPMLSIQTTTNNVQGVFYVSNSEVVIGSNTNNTLRLLQNGGTALTIDTSKDVTFVGDIILSGTVDGRDVSVDGAKLDGIEASADVTDATNVLSAGAVMTTGNQSISGVKTFSDQVTIPATPSASTDAASKGYVDTKVGENNELSEVLANGNTTGSTDIAVSANADITFSDNSKAKFGIGSDLQIYHDTVDSFIKEQGIGALKITSNNTLFYNVGFVKLLANFDDIGVKLYYDNSLKLETTSYGINVTGAINADDYISIEGSTNPYLRIQDTTNEEYLNLYSSDNESAIVYTQDTFKISSGIDFLNQTPRLTIDSSGNSTFAGNVGVGLTADSNIALFIKANGNTYSTGNIVLEDADSTTKSAITHVNGGLYLSHDASTDDLALTSGNATFAGKVTAQSTASNTAGQFAFSTGGNDVGIREDTSGGFNIDVYKSGTGYINPLTIDSSGNSTFTGTVEATNVGINGFITHNGDSGTFMGWSANDTNVFYTAGNERLRIDSSGNVGIGTDDPDYKVDTLGTNQYALRLNTTDADGCFLTLQTNSVAKSYIGTSYHLLLGTQSADDTTIRAEGNLQFSAGGSTERMRITSGGTICVGNTGAGDRTRLDVTAGGSTNFVLQARGTSNGADNTTTTNVLRAVSNDENNWSHAQFNASGYKFGYQSSGTNYMVIDSSGNVGITASASLRFNGAGDNTHAVGYDSTIDGSFLRGQNGMRFLTGTGGGSERMRVTSSGLIQASAGGGGFRVLSDSGNSSNLIDYYYNSSFNHGLEVEGDRGLRMYSSTGDSSAKLTFYTEGTERMRITSGGDLLVGATALSDVGSLTKSHLLEGNSATAGTGAVGVYNNSGTANCPSLVVLNRDTSTDSSNRFIQFYANVIGGTNTPMGGIVGNGASNVQFASLSDIREKENVKTINGSLDKISKLNPVEFDWKKSGEHINAGFIAQEVENIFPEYVVENISNEDEEERKGLTGGMTSGIVAHLVKSIQELKAEVELLKTQINN
jgi:hypothetical protein